MSTSVSQYALIASTSPPQNRSYAPEPLILGRPAILATSHLVKGDLRRYPLPDAEDDAYGT